MPRSRSAREVGADLMNWGRLPTTERTRTGRSVRLATMRGVSFGPLAQLVEQGTLNPKVGGSIPPRPIVRDRAAAPILGVCRSPHESPFGPRATRDERRGYEDVGPIGSFSLIVVGAAFQARRREDVAIRSPAGVTDVQLAVCWGVSKRESFVLVGRARRRGCSRSSKPGRAAASVASRRGVRPGVRGGRRGKRA